MKLQIASFGTLACLYVLVGLGLLAGCDDPEACEQDSDCFSGEICYQQSCTPQFDDNNPATSDDTGGGGQGDSGHTDDSGGPNDDYAGPKVAQVAAGNLHTCALLEEGTVWCWGRCSEGQCGNGDDRSPIPTPTEVTGLSDVRRLVSGYGYSCAIKNDDTLWCWGANSQEQIFPDSDTYKLSPTNVGLADVQQASLAYEHTCALVDNVGVQCWGAYNNGASDRPDGLGDASWVSAGFSHSCAIVSGEVQCWGKSRSGQLGEGNPWVFGITNAIAVEAGRYHTCALLDDKTVECWGDDEYQQLGNSAVGRSETPVTVEDLADVEQLEVTENLSCARTTAGAVECWGSNGYTFGSATATTVFGLTSGVIELSVGPSHACAVKDSGRLVCWGNNQAYKLGDGTETTRDQPVTVKFE